jgi:exonuclease III
MVFWCEARTLKIATFNINNINKGLGNLVAWLAKAQPDVVCLQEIKQSSKHSLQAPSVTSATGESG